MTHYKRDSDSKSHLLHDNDGAVRVLNNVMEFDYVIRVNADGSIDDGIETPGSHTPELRDDALEPSSSAVDKWELMDGYSGQQGYSGPMMHSSEYIGGRMADDILAAPGLYVALVNYTTPDESVPEAERDAYDEICGWAVARILDGE